MIELEQETIKVVCTLHVCRLEVNNSLKLDGHFFFKLPLSA